MNEIDPTQIAEYQGQFPRYNLFIDLHKAIAFLSLRIPPPDGRITPGEAGSTAQAICNGCFAAENNNKPSSRLFTCSCVLPVNHSYPDQAKIDLNMVRNGTQAQVEKAADQILLTHCGLWGVADILGAFFAK